jgi:hypothetical protein
MWQVRVLYDEVTDNWPKNADLQVAGLRSLYLENLGAANEVGEVLRLHL